MSELDLPWARDRDVLAFLAVLRDPADATGAAILADLCADRGYDRLEAELRAIPPSSESDGYGGGGDGYGGYGGSGSGDGSGGGDGDYGYGDGYGDGGSGGGDGDYGYGDGYGDGGHGYGYGGYGYGDGYGDGGHGYGYGYGYGGYTRFSPVHHSRRNVMLAAGDAVLVLVPGSYRNFVWVGRVGATVGAHTYELTDASMVLSSGNGPDWPALARGVNRGQAQFSFAGTVHVGPQFGGVMPWAGELPKGG